MALTQGIHKISNEEYHADPCEQASLSRSTIKDLLYKSPAQVFVNHPRLNPKFKPKEAEQKFDVGTVAHQMLLEGVDNVEIINADDWRKIETKELRDSARAAGKTPLLQKEYDKVIPMVESALTQIEHCPELGIKSLQADGDAELSILWLETDAIGRKSWNRVRPDWWSKDKSLILDYKTTGMSADPDEFTRSITNFGYDIQESYYRRGAQAVTGADPRFVIIAQEIEEPYLCSFIALSPEFQEIGKQKVEYGIFLWNKCIENGGKYKRSAWPGYPNRICHVDPPGWAMAAWEQKAISID